MAQQSARHERAPQAHEGVLVAPSPALSRQRVEKFLVGQGVEGSLEHDNGRRAVKFFPAKQRQLW